jgi:hypothetical protein
VVDAIKQAMGSFVTFTFSTKFLCGVNQILTVIAVIQIPNLRQAFMSKSRNLIWRNVYCKCIITSCRHRFVNLTLPALKIIGVRHWSIINLTERYAKKFGFEKLTGFLNHKTDLI